MPDFVHALQSGATNLWLFIPTAILLGALHGLEPGHSKTMMAAFIVAIRGTVWQAILLGLSAAISHSLIIWVLAALALHFGNQWNAESVEPYLQMGSAVCVFALALWMFLRTRRELAEARLHLHFDRDSHNRHEHSNQHGNEEGSGHKHGTDHDHHLESVVVPTGHGTAEFSIFEEDSPPVFRLAFAEQTTTLGNFAIETERIDGTRQLFAFVEKDGFYESTTEIPEPHDFDAFLTFAHGGHNHTVRVEFRESETPHIVSDDGEYQDAHERAHAMEVTQRFAGRVVTTPQIVLFGITGGLMPCPAAFTVLLVCLQLKRITLGIAMVASFSFGLALTMVVSGTIAALSVRHAQKRFRGFGEIMRRAPYVSCVLLIIIGCYLAWIGVHGLAGHE